MESWSHTQNTRVSAPVGENRIIHRLLVLTQYQRDEQTDGQTIAKSRNSIHNTCYVCCGRALGQVSPPKTRGPTYATRSLVVKITKCQLNLVKYILSIRLENFIRKKTKLGEVRLSQFYIDREISMAMDTVHWILTTSVAI